MSTKLTDRGTYWVVETVSSPHGGRRLARGMQKVNKHDPTAVKTEIIRQAEALRIFLRVPVRKE